MTDEFEIKENDPNVDRKRINLKCSCGNVIEIDLSQRFNVAVTWPETNNGNMEMTGDGIDIGEARPADNNKSNRGDI